MTRIDDPIDLARGGGMKADRSPKERQFSVILCLAMVCLLFGILNLKDGIGERSTGMDYHSLSIKYEITDFFLFISGMILIALAFANLFQAYKMIKKRR